MPRRSSVQHALDLRLTSEKSTYVTGDSIEGVAEIKPATDLHFCKVEIRFLGTSKSAVEKISPVATRGTSTVEAFHVFLQLSQADNGARFPADNILRAGQTYTFPFVFVIPERLLPHACKHIVVDEAVRDAHTHLPPTFGDTDLMRELDLPDDLSPVNASIRYGVYTRLLTQEEQGNVTTVVVLATRAQRVRVIPTTTPGLPSQENTEEHCLRQERMIRNKTLGKMGSMVVEVGQSPSFTLSPPQALRRESVSTKASVQLRFDPAHENSTPPHLDKLMIVLKTYTFFASSKREHIPTKRQIGDDLTQAVHSHQHVLSRRSMAAVEWVKCQPNDRRTEDVAVPDPSKAYKGNGYYVAHITVPITLPPDATFVSTFHSCLLSRVYRLEMRLTVQDGGIWSRTFELTMPTCVSLEGERHRRPTYTETMRQDSIAADWGDEDYAELFSQSRRRSQRQDSVLTNGHFGVRLDELPAYTH